MNAETFSYLLTDEASQILVRLSAEPITEHTHLQLAVKLREQVGADRAHALLETALLRQKALSKFSKADEMFFDRAGLEMSSAEIITTHRARRYAGFHHIADLGCGIGGDAIGLLQHAPVTGIDLNPLRLRMAAENTRTYGSNHPFTTRLADLIELDPFPTDGLFFDPARRDERGRRIFSLNGYRPPITLLEKWKPFTRHWGIKISPGVDSAEIPPDAHTEFISVNHELREAVLWYGDLKPTASHTATLLPSGAALTTSAYCLPVEISTPQAFLYEPDPAILRAGLVQHLATQLNLQQIDPTIAYLTGGRAADTPFARRFAVEGWMPFQLKRLRSYLRERRVGRVTIKKRGSPLEVETLRKQLRLKGKASRTLFLTRVDGDPAVIIAT